MTERSNAHAVPELSLVEFGPGSSAPAADVLARLLVTGSSEVASRLRSRALEVAGSGFAAAIVVGEPGVGKGRVAELLHRGGRRRRDPLTVVDGSGPGAKAQLEQLTEHLRSGAARPPGNVVVRELDRSPSEVPQALLALLAAQGVQLRCGLILLSAEPLAVLRERSLAHGQLLGRAASAVLEVPPLRRRPDDVAELAAALLQEAAARYALPVRGLAPGAVSRLQSYPFPGNVRELAALIETAVLRTSGEYVPAEALGGLPAAAPDPSASAEIVIRMPGSSLREIELAALRLALRLCDGRVVRAAELLGITRHALRRKLDKHGLSGLRQRAGSSPPPDDDACI